MNLNCIDFGQINCRIFLKFLVSFKRKPFLRGEEENPRRGSCMRGGRSDFLDLFVYFLGQCQKVTNTIV